MTTSLGPARALSAEAETVTAGRRTVVTAESDVARVWVLERLAPFVREVMPEARGLLTVALTRREPVPLPATVPEAWPAELTLKVYTCPATEAGVAADPFRVALAKVTPAGSVSTTWAPVAAVWPVFEKRIVYWRASPGFAVRRLTCLSMTRLAGAV